MEETQTLYLSLHRRLCSVFQANALPAPMTPWYGFLLGALTPQLYSPFKISLFFFFNCYSNIFPPEPLPALASLYTLFEGPWHQLPVKIPRHAPWTKVYPQSSETSYAFASWTSLLERPTAAQSMCPLLTKLSVFFLCSLDHRTASSQHQALGFAFQPCF